MIADWRIALQPRSREGAVVSDTLEVISTSVQ